MASENKDLDYEHMAQWRAFMRRHDANDTTILLYMKIGNVCVLRMNCKSMNYRAL